MLARLARISDALLLIAAVVLMLAMLTAVFLGVVFRFLNQPLAWTDELAQYLLVWTGFVGWIIAGNRGSHIRVMALVNLLRGRARQMAEIATHLLVAIFGIILLTRTSGLIGRNLNVMWVSLPLSAALVYIPIPIAGLAVIIQSAIGIARASRADHPSGSATP